MHQNTTVSTKIIQCCGGKGAVFADSATDCSWKFDGSIPEDDNQKWKALGAMTKEDTGNNKVDKYSPSTG